MVADGVVGHFGGLFHGRWNETGMGDQTCVSKDGPFLMIGMGDQGWQIITILRHF